MNYLHMGLVLFLILVFLPVGVLMAGAGPNYKADGAAELISEDYSRGLITRADRIYYNLQTMYAPEALPDRYKSQVVSPMKSGTPLINEAIDNWDLLNPDQQAVLSSYLARPTLQLTFISLDGKFAIHYDTSGLNSVPLEDLDADSIPDYIERIGQYADSAYRFYQIDLGFLPPPDDGDSLYDFFVFRIGNYYGGTVRESAGDSSWGDWSSHIEIHNTMAFAPPNDDPEGPVVGALKVTCAHEYFHATQMAYAYKPSPDLWWTEGTAVFFENKTYDEVNDHYCYLPYFFNYPDTSLIDTNYFSWTYHDYSTFIWPTYLVEKFGIGIIRNVWEYLRWYDVLPSLDSALYPFGKTVQAIFPEFTAWNYFTQDRADTAYYDDGADYPHILIDQVVLTCEFTGLTAYRPPDGLASNYILTVNNPSGNGLLMLRFDGSNSVKWGFSYITFDDDIADLTTGCAVSSVGKTDCAIYDFARYDSMVFIPCVVSQWQDDNPYVFDTEIHPFGDVDGSGAVNILDVTYLMNYLYKNGLPPKYAYYMGDTNCNGQINILDVSYLVSYLYKSGPEPCGYRD
nr:dockerin type I repeat-containing protein [candidate division Zixibacteria bacterium]